MAKFTLPSNVAGYTTTTGTGTITIAGSLTGYRAFSAITDGDSVRYHIYGATGEWEIGVGTIGSSGTTITRGMVLSSTGSAVSFSAGVKNVYVVQAGDDLTHTVNGRLTLTSGTPITTTDVTAATSVYFCPVGGNQITLWDGYAWCTGAFSELTLSLSGYTGGKPYDIWCYLNSGAPTLDSTVWTNDTTRATAVTLQDGRYCKSGDKTRLYLGTIYTTGTGTTEDSANNRYLWNMYNRRSRPLWAADTTANWDYTGGWRFARGESANRVNVLCGVSEDAIQLGLLAFAGGLTNGGAAAIGEDSSSAPHASCLFEQGQNTVYRFLTASLNTIVPVGRHYYAWIESSAYGTNRFYGYDADDLRSGMSGIVWA